MCLTVHLYLDKFCPIVYFIARIHIGKAVTVVTVYVMKKSMLDKSNCTNIICV